ncbi:MAG: hypothetical protein L0229_07680 [Blastocatellia bacterium]|nr:hypothetical protein [Blastocatellia bacterium]
MSRYAVSRTVSDFRPDLELLDVADAVTQKKTWSLTREAFDKFLDCLDGDREQAGCRYEKIRSKLISFFEWRDCPFPEDHADEAINRVVRKIDQGEELRDASEYVFGVARMLLLEIARARENEAKALNLLPVPHAEDGDSDESESRVECLRRCLEELPPEGRELITAYYHGERRSKIENRKRLAERLGIPPNALRIRACRLRERLAGCMDRCMKSLKDVK